MEWVKVTELRSAPEDRWQVRYINLEAVRRVGPHMIWDSPTESTAGAVIWLAPGEQVMIVRETPEQIIKVWREADSGQTARVGGDVAGYVATDTAPGADPEWAEVAR